MLGSNQQPNYMKYFNKKPIAPTTNTTSKTTPYLQDADSPTYPKATNKAVVDRYDHEDDLEEYTKDSNSNDFSKEFNGKEQSNDYESTSENTYSTETSPVQHIKITQESRAKSAKPKASSVSVSNFASQGTNSIPRDTPTAPTTPSSTSGGNLERERERISLGPTSSRLGISSPGNSGLADEDAVNI
jgi:hypothetical protein